MASQRGSDTSPADRDQASCEYLQTSESSTTSSATDPDPREPSTAAAAGEQSTAAGEVDRGASGVDTDATTCDTVSATMWFDRPEVATSFVTRTASDDDDEDVNSINSNNYNDEDGKTT